MRMLLLLLSFLCNLLKEDEKKGLREIFKRYQVEIINFLTIKFYGNAQLAEELYQDAALAFIKFVNENKVNFENDKKIKNFIITIAMNRFKNYLKKEKKTRSLFKFFENEDDFNSFLSGITEKSDNPEESIVTDDQKKLIQNLVSSTLLKLPSNYQEVLSLKFLDNKSNMEIAQSLNTTVKATESLLFRAKEAFRKNLRNSALNDEYTNIE